MTRKSLTASKINSRLADLEPKLQQIAKKVSRYAPDGDWQDMYQIILKSMLERQANDQTFFEQKDAFIYKYALFAAKNAARKAQVYLRYVDEEGAYIDPDDADDTTDVRLELETREKLVQSIARVETEVMQNELADAIAEGCQFLTGDNLKVVYLLYLGYKQVEIAEIMGISKPAVNQRIKTIASTLCQ